MATAVRMVVRWPGHIKPGTVKNQMFAALDWLPTLVDIAGGPKGDELNQQIQAGKYPGIVKTMLDGVDQRAYLEGKSDKSARDVFFYYSGATPSAVRYKNWKMYYSMAPGGRRAGSCRSNLSLDPGRQHQARPIRADGRLRGLQVGHGAWVVHWPPQQRPICMTGTCCPSASCCGRRNSCPSRSSRHCRLRRPTT